MGPGASSHFGWGVQPGCIVVEITGEVNEQGLQVLPKMRVPGFGTLRLDYFQKESWVQ